VWDRATKTARCLGCTVPAQREAPVGEAPSIERVVNFGTAGASARRLYEAKESRRRAGLRRNWWRIVIVSLAGALLGRWLAVQTDSNVAFFVILGGALPVLKLLPSPQHITAWQIGAAGEQTVGRMLDRLRDEGVVAIHDRRVPGRRTNIDHIAVSPAGIFVIDTKNVSGRVSVTRRGVTVAGRQQDKMVTGVQQQVSVVRDVIADQGLDSNVVRGVLCFTKADLPWFRPSPGGVLLHYPRGLRRELRQAGALDATRVQPLAELIARRLPSA
jgi:hypothetical protein